MATIEENSCSICLEGDGELCITGVCEHRFHRDCIQMWKKTGGNTCPLCRIDLGHDFTQIEYRHGPSEPSGPSIPQYVGRAYRSSRYPTILLADTLNANNLKLLISIYRVKQRFHKKQPINGSYFLDEDHNKLLFQFNDVSLWGCQLTEDSPMQYSMTVDQDILNNLQNIAKYADATLRYSKTENSVKVGLHPCFTKVFTTKGVSVLARDWFSKQHRFIPTADLLCMMGTRIIEDQTYMWIRCMQLQVSEFNTAELAFSESSDDESGGGGNSTIPKNQH